MHDQALSVRFLGVRGSIATPGPSSTAGGNTRVSRSPPATRGSSSMRDGPADARQRAHGERPEHSTILLSHLHWDHVCGLPFFTPIYVPGSPRRDRERPERRDAARGRDPIDVPRAVLSGRLRRPRRSGDDARAARERSVHDR